MPGLSGPARKWRILFTNKLLHAFQELARWLPFPALPLRQCAGVNAEFHRRLFLRQQQIYSRDGELKKLE